MIHIASTPEVRSLLAAGLVFAGLVTSPHALADSPSAMTGSGFTGFGAVPDARTLPAGTASIHYQNAIVGANNPAGHSTVVGFGLTPQFEVSGRLVTQRSNCNMLMGECPEGTIRDLSGSFKWSPRIDWLQRLDTRVALGGVDVGGAANLSNAYYAVATHSRRWFDLTAGVARAGANQSPLKGAFGDITFKPWSFAQAGVQVVDRQAWAHAGVRLPMSWMSPDAALSLGYVKRLREADAADGAPSGPPSPANWWAVSLTVPLAPASAIKTKPEPSPSTRTLPALDLERLPAALKAHGFHTVHTHLSARGRLEVVVENTAYRWNLLDAAGVAAALIAAADRREGATFHLTVQTLGIDQLHMESDTACVRRWIEEAAPCASLKISSALARGASSAGALDDMRQFFSTWRLPRPEVVISPVINSTIGTELGAFDYDIAASINLLVPLWKGALLDVNRLEPTEWQSDDFERGYWRNTRYKPVTNRRMLHQVVSIPSWNTQLRLSHGTVYESWEGTQLEVQGQTPSGQDRASVYWGKFDNPTYYRSNRREYLYLNWRHAWNAEHSQTTTLTLGEFWGGDRGFQVAHRFWFGESNVAIYARESSFGYGGPKASFVGLALTVPLTPRRLDGWTWLGLRGSAQFSYAAETRVRNPSNDVGGGYGITPAMGEPLLQTFNRDRNGNEYLSTQTWRVRRAAVQLLD